MCQPHEVTSLNPQVEFVVEHQSSLSISYCRLVDKLGPPSVEENPEKLRALRRETVGSVDTDEKWGDFLAAVGRGNFEPAVAPLNCFYDGKSTTEWYVKFRGHTFQVYDYGVSELTDINGVKIEDIRSDRAISWSIKGEKGADIETFLGFLNR